MAELFSGSDSTILSFLLKFNENSHISIQNTLSKSILRNINDLVNDVFKESHIARSKEQIFSFFLDLAPSQWIFQLNDLEMESIKENSHNKEFFLNIQNHLKQIWKKKLSSISLENKINVFSLPYEQVKSTYFGKNQYKFPYLPFETK